MVSAPRRLPGRSRTRKRVALVTVDPSAVYWHYFRRSSIERLTFYLSGVGLPDWRRRGAWDLRCVPVTEHPTHRLLRQFYHSGYDPSATDRYREMMRTIEAGRSLKTRRGFSSSRADIHRYFQRYRDLMESLATHGYQAGLAKDEINIAVGRAGTLIKVANGNHRLFAAQIVGLDSVVAELRFVHERWLQDERAWDTRKRAVAKERLRDLPGVLDLISD